MKSEMYSQYKSTFTLKGLLEISPSGRVTFVSSLYSGAISDRELAIQSGLLDQEFHHGDSILADCGFLIDDLLAPLGVNIPSFLGQRQQQEKEEVLETQRIAAERIHIERAIDRVKSFGILSGLIQVGIAGSINQIWTVYVCLRFTKILLYLSSNVFIEQ
eukprot:m.270807 g.270807  ORF g.270807 m.270807 type:complete len:160 (+) comp40544_c2_seq26:1429-1908(+)